MALRRTPKARHAFFYNVYGSDGSIKATGQFNTSGGIPSNPNFLKETKDLIKEEYNYPKEYVILFTNVYRYA